MFRGLKGVDRRFYLGGLSEDWKLSADHCLMRWLQSLFPYCETRSSRYTPSFYLPVPLPIPIDSLETTWGCRRAQSKAPFSLIEAERWRSSIGSLLFGWASTCERSRLSYTRKVMLRGIHSSDFK